MRQALRIRIGFRRNRNISLHNPSVMLGKHDSSLYTREPFGRSRASTIIVS